ncbi:hypothetical protein ACFVH6_22150 [Spirillospora sp. NPDC127200]
MARIRTIKPEFFTSLTIADLTPEQRLTFIGLWTHVDDTGRCVDDPRLVKAAVWPLDDRTSVDVEDDLRAIHAKALIVRYVVAGKRFIAVTGWAEHQKINRPSKSKFPSPDDGDPLPPTPREPSLRTHGGLSEGSFGPGEGVREGAVNGHGTGSAADEAVTSADDPEIEGQSDNGDAPTSENAEADPDSVSPHGALTEGSLPERNREQGTGNREKNVSEIAPRPSDAPKPRDLNDGREDVERVCEHLAARMVENGCTPPTITKAWRDAARLMIDKDGRTEEDIHTAIAWCQNHDFWRANVMSLPKLREKYDQLSLQAQRDGNVTPISRGQNRPATGTRRAQQALDAGRELQAMIDRGEISL